MEENTSQLKISPETKIIYKRLDIVVDTADKTYKKTFNLDKNVIRIKGLLWTGDLTNKVYYRASAKIVISGDEIFPDNYHTRLLMSGLNVSPNQRYHDLDLLPGSWQVKVDLADNAHPTELFAAYVAHLYLKLEVE